jgi:hypothetical protein
MERRVLIDGHSRRVGKERTSSVPTILRYYGWINRICTVEPSR